MHFLRTALLLAVAFILVAGSAAVAQNNKKLDPEAGYIPTVAPPEKSKKKKSEDTTQALALPPELPAAVVAETGRLAFQVTPLSGKGLLSQQTREALKGLLHSSHGPIVKLRAFVAGTGDLRRVGDIAGEMFQEKHMPLPVLTVVQVGALPLEGAQVEIEATELDRKTVNPAGVGFVAAQSGATVAESLTKLGSAIEGAGLQRSDALIVTCFVSSFDDQRDIHPAMSASFADAALDYVQMQRGPVTPAATCEATVRATKPASSNSQITFVVAPEMVITGTQLAFGAKDSDLKLAFERLDKALMTKNARFDQVVFSHLYVTSAGLASRVSAIENAHSRGVTVVLPVEALPSLDAPFGLDVIAVGDTEQRR